MGIFPEINVIQKFWSAKNFSVPPKLGARSPPLCKIGDLGIVLRFCPGWAVGWKLRNGDF